MADQVGDPTKKHTDGWFSPLPPPKPTLLERLMTEPWRRRVCVALIVPAPLVAGVTIGATVHNPRHYVYVTDLAHPFLGPLAALAMLMLVSWIGLKPGLLRVIVFWVLGAAMALACCGDTQVASFESEFGPSGHSVVATSAHFRLVEYTYPGFFNSGTIGLRIRSRDGLLSREGDDDVACFSVPESEAGNEWLFGSARFTSDTTIAVTAKDGTHWTVSFDPTTLDTDYMLDRCTDAPDIMAD